MSDAQSDIFAVGGTVSVTHKALAIVPAFILTFGLVSSVVKDKLHLGEATVATAIGILIGPHGAGIFDPRSWTDDFDHLLLEVIALGVFAVGAELPRRYLRIEWRSLAILLGPNMLYGWVSCAALIYALLPNMTLLQSLAISSAITPTDPILAASVVGRSVFARKHIPGHIRELLTAESGSNGAWNGPWFS